MDKDNPARDKCRRRGGIKWRGTSAEREVLGGVKMRGGDGEKQRKGTGAAGWGLRLSRTNVRWRKSQEEM